MAPVRSAEGRSAREGSEQEEEISPKEKMREGGRKGGLARARGKSERTSGAGEEEAEEEEEPVEAKSPRQRMSEGGRKGGKATQRKRGTAKESEEEGEEGEEEEEPAEAKSPRQRTSEGGRKGGKATQRKRGSAKEEASEESEEEAPEEASGEESGAEKSPKQRMSEGGRKGGKATKGKAEEGAAQEGSPDKSLSPRERMSQGGKKGGRATAQRASGQSAGSPANKRAKQERGAEPTEGDGGPAESNRTLESGTVTFLYKPRVGLDEASSLEDVQRFYLLLEPQPSKSKARLLIIGKKRMPKETHERMFGFVAAVDSSPVKLAQGLGPSDYTTKTKGERHAEGARVVGVGAYSVVTKGDHTHFAYTLNAPGTPGAAQDAFEIKEEATYIISIKLLDTAKAELLLIGVTTNLASELGEAAKHVEAAAEDEDKDAILKSLHAERAGIETEPLDTTEMT
ncbi:hypothetical protein H632_c33p1 [Helicosporidium sp. ATCC 50920]|nr:hypothetical protein H632_c33p1 [Helicosporidium sp. ATCC 50920]|eukprot:KDD77042.1 hypothetical protein H632_c33p1 [Helicosporidium sp. ATCC 50920]